MGLFAVRHSERGKGGDEKKLKGRGKKIHLRVEKREEDTKRGAEVR